MKKTYFLTIFSLLVLIALFFLYQSSKKPSENTIIDQPPSDEQPSEQFYYTNTSADEIIVTSPLPGDKITSPLKVTGMARGSWFFEATAPMVITNWDGLIIGEGYVTAQGDWMTEDFVAFEGIIEFEKPEFGERATLIFQNSNASGLPEHDRAVEMNLRFE